MSTLAEDRVAASGHDPPGRPFRADLAGVGPPRGPLGLGVEFGLIPIEDAPSWTSVSRARELIVSAQAGLLDVVRV